MPMRANVAAGLDCVKQTLACIFVTFVDIAVLPAAWIAPCLLAKALQKFRVESFYQANTDWVT